MSAFLYWRHFTLCETSQNRPDREKSRRPADLGVVGIRRPAATIDALLSRQGVPSLAGCKIAVPKDGCYTKLNRARSRCARGQKGRAEREEIPSIARTHCINQLPDLQETRGVLTANSGATAARGPARTRNRPPARSCGEHRPICPECRFHADRVENEPAEAS